MAASIELPFASGDDVVFYNGGSVTTSRYVGTEGTSTSNPRARVVRYTFTAPASGASGVALTFYANGLYEGGVDIPLRFFIGTDPSSHAKGGLDLEYLGELSMVRDSNGETFTGEAKILLLPNKTYYLWVFPGVDQSKVYGEYRWYRSASSGVTNTIAIKGGAGVVYVGGVMYQIYVGNSAGGADLRLPYSGKADGSANLLS